MSVSKGFLVTGAIWLVIGFIVGIFMAATRDFSLAPLHVHINLVGFTLMTAFGLGYALLPGLAPRLSRLHYGLHQIGTLAMMIGLWLLYGTRGNETLAEFLLVPSSFMILGGGILWLLNLVQRPATA